MQTVAKKLLPYFLCLMSIKVCSVCAIDDHNVVKLQVNKDSTNDDLKNIPISVTFPKGTYQWLANFQIILNYYYKLIIY